MKENGTTSKVYGYIVEYGDMHGYPPSFREIAEELGIKSPSTIFYHINKLISDGLIKKDSYKNRTLHTAEKRTSVQHKNIPIVGKVAAGVPILAVENVIDNLQLPSTLFRGNELFSLVVKGDSMINAGIFDGDMIIVSRQSAAENGEIVVVMLDDEVTTKRLFKEKSRIRLQPENDNYEPIYATSFNILGKVVGLIRNI